CNDRVEGVVKEALGQVVGWEERWGDDLKGARADLEEALFTLGPDFWQGSWRDVLEARWKTVAESEEWQTSQEGGAALEIWGLAPWHRYDKENHVSDAAAATWLPRGPP